MTLQRALWVDMETQAFVLGLLGLWISGTSTFPLISEEDEPGELCDYSEPDSNSVEQNKDWGENNANIVCAGETENVYSNCITNFNMSDTDFEPDEYIIETRDNIPVNEEPLDEEQFTAPEETTDMSLFYQTVSDELEPPVLAEGTISQNIKKTKVKRSSLFDNMQEEDDETTKGGVERKTVKGDNVQEVGPSTNSQNSPPNAETTPKSWFWSWLFKSSLPEQRNTEQNTGTAKVVKESCSEESTNNGKEVEKFPQTMSSETAEETINTLDSGNDHDDKEKNNTGQGCGNDLSETFEKGNPDNFTTEIHKEEAILEQEIKDHNPGITTTEALWNTDEFVDKTSK